MQFQSLLFPLLIVLLAVPLFMQARKQKKMAAEQQKLQNSLGTGDRVMTTSGVFGTIVDSAEDTIDVEIAPGVRTTWVRQAIREKVNPEQDESTTDDDATGDSAVNDKAADDEAVNDKAAEKAADDDSTTVEAVEGQKAN